jgi:hypothetical protein
MNTLNRPPPPPEAMDILASENMLDINIEAPSKAEIEQALSELKRNKNTRSTWYHGRGTISKHKK